jgi:hypothetical protein
MGKKENKFAVISQLFSSGDLDVSFFLSRADAKAEFKKIQKNGSQAWLVRIEEYGEGESE